MVRPTLALQYTFGLKPRGSSIMMVMPGQKDVLLRGESFSTRGNNNVDERVYFDGKLLVIHHGKHITPQSLGAVLPAVPNLQQDALSYTPYKKLSWTQGDVVREKIKQLTSRSDEKTIMGEAAKESIARGGVEPLPKSAWAHTLADYLNYDDRLGKEFRVPGYQAANQVHTAFESAAVRLAKLNDSIKVTRKLGDNIPASNGLVDGLHLGFVLDGKNEEQYHFTHFQPYFSMAGARHGDDEAIAIYINDNRGKIANDLPTTADKITKVFGDDKYPADEFGGHYPSISQDFKRHIIEEKSKLEKSPQEQLTQPSARLNERIRTSAADLTRS
jgi:hypothetical protein